MFTGEYMSNALKTSLIQLLLIAVYFPLYALNIWAALIYSGAFMIMDLRSWSRAIKGHAYDNHFIYLFITICTSFMAVIFFFANIYEILGTVAITGTEQYIKGLWEHLYFSVVTFTTLGYGEYTPRGYAKLAASIQAILGLGYFAFIVGVSSAMFYSKVKKT